MSSTTPNTHNDDDLPRFVCPLSGDPLRPTEDGWYCEHDSSTYGGGHETIVALDTSRGRLVRQHGQSITNLNPYGDTNE